MLEIYQHALRQARQKVFDDDGRNYSAIIDFCKAKLADKWYNEHLRAWDNKNAFTTL